ncbi:MAG TPA: DUF397 domain-containing protein [Pseudonocardiaceae bacterium]|nr:DUF397 domain-containing protein [Pseudonocardiaceae bacterium]
MGGPIVSDDQRWRKSSRSNGSDSCVELNGMLDAVRDSKNPDGPVLPVAGLSMLLSDVKSGRFDRQ